MGQNRRRSVIGAALPGTAVTGEAALGKIKSLTVGGVASRGVLFPRRRQRASGENCRGERHDRDTLEPLHHKNSSARISDDIDDSRLAALNGGHSARQRRRQIFWI